MVHADFPFLHNYERNYGLIHQCLDVHRGTDYNMYLTKRVALHGCPSWSRFRDALDAPVMVELKGVEPLTSCLQSRRSGQLSYSPTYWKKEQNRMGAQQAFSLWLVRLRRTRPNIRYSPTCQLSVINCELSIQYALFFRVPL